MKNVGHPPSWYQFQAKSQLTMKLIHFSDRTVTFWKKTMNWINCDSELERLLSYFLGFTNCRSDSFDSWSIQMASSLIMFIDFQHSISEYTALWVSCCLHFLCQLQLIINIYHSDSFDMNKSQFSTTLSATAGDIFSWPGARRCLRVCFVPYVKTSRMNFVKKYPYFKAKNSLQSW